MTVVLLALGAASLFGTSAVLMHSRAHTAPPESSMRPALLLHLAREPIWLAGVVAQLAGFGLQATALARGSLIVVQTLGPTSLLVALLLGARLSHKRLRPSEWAGAAATVGGLAAVLLVAAPGTGQPNPTTRAWSVVFATTLAVAGGVVLVARRRVGPVKALALGTAGGALLALAAALTKVAATRFGHGLASGLGSWETYALVGLGLMGTLVIQSSFQAGAIEWSVPATTVTIPVVSVIVGASAFHESISSGAPAITALAVSGIVMVAGVVLLAQSPAVASVARVP